MIWYNKDYVVVLGIDLIVIKIYDDLLGVVEIVKVGGVILFVVGG